MSNSQSRSVIAIVCLFLIAITWFVFAQTMRHDFFNYDDGDYVYDNATVSRGLTVAGVTWAFTHVHARNWHPLTTISHMFDCQLYGQKAGGHHFTNVILHTLAVLLLFLVLRQMTGAVWRSAFVAALFAIHPQRVESVAWIAERKDVLSGVFFMLTLGAYLYYLRKPSLARYLTMSILFGCGLMSKPMLVTLPLVLLLLDYWPLKRESRPAELILEKVPLLVLSAASSVVTFLVQKQGGFQSDALPFVWRVENALVSYITYIRQMLWPVDLAPIYPHPENSLPVWEIALALVLLVTITVIALWRRRTIPYVVTGWFWYLIVLLPVIGIVQVGAQGWADRYTYLPAVGLYMLLTWGMFDLAAGWRYRSQILSACGALVLIACAWCSSIQASYWRNSETLWRHTLAVTSSNEVAQNNLGSIFYDRGQTDEALSYYEKALEIRLQRHASKYDVLLALFHSNVGAALLKKGLVDEAIVHCQKAIQLQPDYPNGYINLGNALIDKGQIDDAIVVFREAIQLQPEDARIEMNVGDAFRRKGMEAEAIAHYERTLEINPRSISALNNLAWLLATSPDSSIRNGTKAVALSERAVQLSGAANPFFLHKLAAAHAESGDFQKALAVAERALQLASEQNQKALAQELQRDIKLYRANTPLRSGSSTNATPSP